LSLRDGMNFTFTLFQDIILACCCTNTYRNRQVNTRLQVIIPCSISQFAGADTQ
jgi:hypothetical protein